MSDPQQFSDDISALWGPADDGVLDPGPPLAERIARPPVAPPPASVGDAARLAALEARLDAIRSEVGAQLDEELAAIEARLQQRLTEIGERVAAAGPRTTSRGSVVGRVDELERQMHEGLTRMHRSVESSRTGTVSRIEVEALRSELRANFMAELDQLRSESAAADDARMDVVRGEFSGRLDALEQQVKDDLAGVARSVDAGDAQIIGRAEFKTLWANLRTTLTKSLTDVRSQAIAASDTTLRAAKAELDERLGRIEEALTSLSLRIDAVAAQRTSPLAALRSDLRLLQDEVRHLNGTVADLESRRRPRKQAP